MQSWAWADIEAPQFGQGVAGGSRRAYSDSSSQIDLPPGGSGGGPADGEGDDVPIGAADCGLAVGRGGGSFGAAGELAGAAPDAAGSPGRFAGEGSGGSNWPMTTGVRWLG